MTETCLYETYEGRCWQAPEAYGYCRKHVASAPEEAQAYQLLIDKITIAKRKLDDIGENILKSYVVFGDDNPPEELKRDYRNAWYRWNYLTNTRNTRRPGTPLPAEVTMRSDE